MRTFLRVFVGLAVVALISIPATLFFLSGHSEVTFDPVPRAIGTATSVSVTVSNPHGVRSVAARIEQNGSSTPVFNESREANRLWFWREDQAAQTFAFTILKERVPVLEEGQARLVVEVQSGDLRGVRDAIAVDVPVVFEPPRLATDGAQHYINQGGSELVRLYPSGNWSEAGVQIGDLEFPSFPAPALAVEDADGLNAGGPADARLALFAYPWDLDNADAAGTAPRAFAGNLAGERAYASFWHKVLPKSFRARDIGIDDAFLNKMVNQIDPSGSGSLLERFLRINRDMRRENNQTLADLRMQTAPEFLWTETFLQMPGSQVESQFADVRTYLYKGEAVDQQTHLGFDLATVQHGPVNAANAGRVVWAKDLGIYGNCVVIDHGLGLQSIYAHLSVIDVQEGQMVARGESLGRTGSTGLAGGDHLHFSMQVNGVQVNPIEWWDAHWIADHITPRLAGE